jgi:hypothetical protein
VPTPGRRVQRPTAKPLRRGLESSARHPGEGHSGGSASSTSAAGRHNRRSNHAKLTLHGPCPARAGRRSASCRCQGSARAAAVPQRSASGILSAATDRNGTARHGWRRWSRDAARACPHPPVSRSGTVVWGRVGFGSVRFSHQDSPAADAWTRHRCRSGPCGQRVSSATWREPAPRSLDRGRR